jgi:hypothetical protein
MNRIFLMHIRQFRKKIMLINSNLSRVLYEARDRLIKFIQQEIRSLNRRLRYNLYQTREEKQNEKSCTTYDYCFGE